MYPGHSRNSCIRPGTTCGCSRRSTPRSIGPKLSLRAVEFLQDASLELGPHRYRYSLLAGYLPGSTAPVYLIDCPVLYSRPTLYTTDVDEHLRFLVLTRAAFECCQRMSWSPAIVHCNDWHTAFGPLYPQGHLQLGPAVREREVGAHHSQHRVSGHLQRARGRQTSGSETRRISSTRTTCAPGE